jgi:GNAT superfamily N-acetyltransferase
MAYYDDKIAWCIAGIIEKTGDEDSLGFCIEKIWIIKELFIEETYRNFGIWWSLMQKVESYFLENWINYCWVEVFAENENAYNFYKKRWYNSRMISLNKKLWTKM